MNLPEQYVKNMKKLLGEKEFEEALTNAEKNNCLFGIWRKNIG